MEDKSQQLQEELEFVEVYNYDEEGNIVVTKVY